MHVLKDKLLFPYLSRRSKWAKGSVKHEAVILWATHHFELSILKWCHVPEPDGVCSTPYLSSFQVLCMSFD